MSVISHFRYQQNVCIPISFLLIFFTAKDLISVYRIISFGEKVSFCKKFLYNVKTCKVILDGTSKKVLDNTVFNIHLEGRRPDKARERKKRNDEKQYKKQGKNKECKTRTFQQTLPVIFTIASSSQYMAFADALSSFYSVVPIIQIQPVTKDNRSQTPLKQKESNRGRGQIISTA